MNIKNIIAVALLGMTILAGCKKAEDLRTPETTDLSGKAFIKVYNGTSGSPITNIFVNDVKYTGAVVAYSGIFPASTTYAAVDAGSKIIKVTDTASTAPKLNLSIPATLDAGKYYTLFMYDTLATAKVKVVNDDIQQPADTTSRIRFANLIQAPLANVDLYSQNLKANIFSNVPAADVTMYKPHPSKVTDTFYIRATGTVVNLSNGLITAPGERRSYTFVFRGRYATTTGTLTRTLTVITNY